MISERSRTEARLTFVNLKSGATREVTTSERIGTCLNWSADRRSLFAYVLGEMPAVIRRIDVTTGRVSVERTIRLADPKGAWRVHPIRITRSGKTVAYTVARDLGDLYVYAGLK